MDLKEALLVGYTKSQANKIIAYVGEDKERFNQLITLFFDGEYKISQRAGWPISDIAIKQPLLFKPYLAKAIHHIQNPSVHNSMVRNILRVIQYVELPEVLQGEVLMLCLTCIQAPKQQIAIKAYAITVLKNICRSYPELAAEVSMVVKQRLPFESPAFKVRARDFLNAFTS